MPFSDFVENVIEAPICCELKQHLDALNELYTKDPEKCALYLTSILRRGSAKSDFLVLLPLLLTLYNERRYIMKITICDICGNETPTIKFVDDNIKDLNFCISSNGKIWDICDKCRVNLNKWMAMQRKENQNNGQ